MKILCNDWLKSRTHERLQMLYFFPLRSSASYIQLLLFWCLPTFSLGFNNITACSVGFRSGDWLVHWWIFIFFCLEWLFATLGLYPCALWESVLIFLQHLTESEQEVYSCTLHNLFCCFFQQWLPALQCNQSVHYVVNPLCFLKASLDSKW